MHLDFCRFTGFRGLGLDCGLPDIKAQKKGEIVWVMEKLVEV